MVVIIFHYHGTRYLGKMFNDDWMRDRGFLQIAKPKALDLISSHKNQKLITVEANATVTEALGLMSKYGISQIPVTKGKEFVGSLNDSYLFSKLIESNDVKNKNVESLMQKAFPVVDSQETIDEISRLITKDNNAVLMRDLGGNTHIITKHDVIQAVAQMGN